MGVRQERDVFCLVLKIRRLPEMGRIISISRCCLSFPLSLWLRLSCRRESLRRWFPFIRSCWVLFFFALVTIWKKIVSARLNCLIMSLYSWRNLEIHYFLVQTDKSKISKPHSVHVSSFYKTRCHHSAQQITKRLRSPFLSRFATCLRNTFLFAKVCTTPPRNGCKSSDISTQSFD